jgi:lipopolysaccharide/colanic/teichoic acid biosynthesis glycosyltransferase
MPLPALFARYPFSRQTLVVTHDVTAVTVSLPLAVMLRDSAVLDGRRLYPSLERAVDIAASATILLLTAPLLALAAITTALQPAPATITVGAAE